MAKKGSETPAGRQPARRSRADAARKAGRAPGRTRRKGVSRNRGTRLGKGSERRSKASRQDCARSARKAERGQTARKVADRPAKHPALLGGSRRNRRDEATPRRRQTGRTVRGRDQPDADEASTGRAAGARQYPRHAPGLERERRSSSEVEENVPTPPSSLDLDRTASAARAAVAASCARHGSSTPRPARR